MTVTVAMLCSVLPHYSEVPRFDPDATYSHSLTIRPLNHPWAGSNASSINIFDTYSCICTTPQHAKYSLTWSASVATMAYLVQGLAEAGAACVQVVAAIREYDALRQLIRSSSLLIRSSSVSLIPPFCVWLVRISLGLSSRNHNKRRWFDEPGRSSSDRRA